MQPDQGKKLVRRNGRCGAGFRPDTYFFFSFFCVCPVRSGGLLRGLVMPGDPLFCTGYGQAVCKLS